MKHANRILVAAVVGLVSAALRAQPPTDAGKAQLPAGHPDISSAPATQPALPPGHPALPAGHPALPAGHPQITPSTQPTLPAGHPPLPAGHPQIPGGGQGRLPSGHPDFSASNAPVSDGVLAVRVRQGTKDAPAVRKDTRVTVEMLHRGQVIRKTEAKLNERGVAIIQNLPLLLPFQPIVSVQYNGTTFRGFGQLMDADHAAQQVDVTIYETTDAAPNLSIPSRHLMLDPQADGTVKVTDILAIENPSDKAWLGTPAADGRRLVLTVAIPPGVSTVDIRGFVGGDLRLAPGELTVGAPLVPGITQLQYSYSLPVRDGQVRLTATAPAAVTHMMVVIPDNGTKLEARGLEAGGPVDTGNGRSLIFKASNLKPGDQTLLTLTPAKRADVGLGNSSTPQVVAAVGGGLVLAIGTGYILLKKPKPVDAAHITQAS